MLPFLQAHPKKKKTEIVKILKSEHACILNSLSIQKLKHKTVYLNLDLQQIYIVVCTQFVKKKFNKLIMCGNFARVNS